MNKNKKKSIPSLIIRLIIRLINGSNNIFMYLHKRHLPSGAPGHISAKPCALLHLSGVISCAAKSNINREPIKQQKQEKDVKKNKRE